MGRRVNREAQSFRFGSCHGQASQDRRNRHTRRPGAAAPARPGGPRRLRLTASATQRNVVLEPRHVYRAAGGATSLDARPDRCARASPAREPLLRGCRSSMFPALSATRLLRPHSRRIICQSLGHCIRKQYSYWQQGYVRPFSRRSASFASIPSPMQ